MTDGIPQVILGINEASESVVILGKDTEANSLHTLLAAAPGLMHPDAAATLSRATAHLAAGAEYRVIEDPEAYEASYRAQLATEDPDAPWTKNAYRLRDHGVPDFTQIHAPRLSGKTLVFFATPPFLPLPYRVELDQSDTQAVLTPDVFRAVSLQPLPAGTRPKAPNPLFVGAVTDPDENADDSGLPQAELPPLVIEDVGPDDAPDEP